jgi:hypothetical protein
MADSSDTARLRSMQDWITPTSSHITDISRARIADASVAMALLLRDDDDDNDDNNNNGNNDGSDGDSNGNDYNDEGLAVAGIPVASWHLMACRARLTKNNVGPLRQGPPGPRRSQRLAP